MRTDHAPAVSSELRRARLFSTLSPDDVDLLCARIETLEVARGKTVFRQGEAYDGVYIVLFGKVKLATQRENGRQKVVDVMGPSDQFGELSLFEPGVRATTATALTDAQLARLPKAVLQRWLIEQPLMGMQLLQVLAYRVRRSNTLLADQVFVDIPGRLAKQLLDFAHRFGTAHRGGLQVDYDLSQGELAQLIGSSRETLNKTLSDFAARGWIEVQNKSVLILDRERLRRRAR